MVTDHAQLAIMNGRYCGQGPGSQCLSTVTPRPLSANHDLLILLPSSHHYLLAFGDGGACTHSLTFENRQPLEGVKEDAQTFQNSIFLNYDIGH